MRRWMVVCCVTVAAVTRAGAGTVDINRPFSTILIDATSGETLLEQDADASRPTGSLNQLMVLLLSLEAGRLGTIAPGTPVTISAAATGGTAASSAGSRGATEHGIGCNTPAGNRIPLTAGKTYPLSDLLKAMIMGSANDAAIAVAESVAGSVAASLELMNARAQSLGAQATHYASIGGLRPPGVTGCDTTSARDLARLAQAVIRDPHVLQWAALSGLPFDGGLILLRNVNQFIGTLKDVDGLYVSSSPPAWHRPSSYSVVATAQRGALRLIAVVLDAPTSAVRYSAAAELLDWGFAQYERPEIVKKGEPVNVSIDVLNGSVSRLTPVAGQSFSFMRQRGEDRDFQLRYQVPAVLAAPVKRHDEIGEILVEEHGQLVAVIPLLSPTTVEHIGILSAGLP